MLYVAEDTIMRAVLIGGQAVNSVFDGRNQALAEKSRFFWLGVVLI